MKLEGKTAIVTGATSGIGKSIAIAFSKEGANVTLVGRDEERLGEVEETIQQNQGRCLTVQADLLSFSDIKAIVEKTVAEFGQLDILVNSAGIFEVLDFFEVTERFYDRTMDINLKALFFMTQSAARQMKDQNMGGKIINLSSVGGGMFGFPTGSVYCYSKGAVVSFTQALGSELAPHKINVNAICPGNIRTPMNEHLLANPDYLNQMLSMTPMGRIGETPDITSAAIFLASSDSDYMTGTKMVIDGGASAI